MQGTPNHEELVESLEASERNRNSDLSIEEQVRDLVRQFLQEAELNDELNNELDTPIEEWFYY